MKVAALFSGGKDSVFAVYIATQYGWDITTLVTLFPEQSDSWMFHSINITQTDLIAKALGIPLVKKKTRAEKETELSDLQQLLENLDIDGVISGAIASEYQRTRIERVCDDLGLKSFTPLWHKNQEHLLRDQIQAGFHIIIVSVSADGFDETWLGKTIDAATLNALVRLRKTHGINIAGEGGEYETLVLSGPLFSQKIIIDSAEKHWERDSGVFVVQKSHLEQN
jgi:diphthine-ammonia ligase